jgi:copper chaperone
MAARTYAVTGMTCDHCVHAVRAEVSALPGVTEVSIELVVDGSSAVRIVSDEPISDEDVARSLDEAGPYQLA